MILYDIVDIVMQLRNPNADLQGVKEHLAMYCEQLGDVRVVSITPHKPPEPQQMRIDERKDGK